MSLILSKTLVVLEETEFHHVKENKNMSTTIELPLPVKNV